MLAELIAAFMLLTRLPVGWLGQYRANDAFASAVWAYPIVGATVGAIGAAIYLVCAGIGLPPSLAAICALATTITATGGLHEDALADMVDGFGSGGSRARKLEIMHDSHIGSFGVLALVLSVAARGTAIAAIAVPNKVALALIGAGTLARGAMLVQIVLLAPARTDGLGAGLRTATKARTLIGLVLSAAVPFLLLPPFVAAGATGAAMVSALCLSVLAWRQIGGYTGDVLGTTEVAVECAVLGLLTASWSISML